MGGVLSIFHEYCLSYTPELWEDLFAPDDILALCSLNKEEDVETLPSKCDPLLARQVAAPIVWD